MLLDIILPILFIGVGMALVVYLRNRSRWTFEQAIQLSGCSEADLQEFIKEKLVDYRRKYIVYGPRSFDRYALEQARHVYPELKRLQAETDATLRKMVEDIVAQMSEANRVFQEQERMRQEELARMKRIREAMLRELKETYVPQKVIDAFRVLELSVDASFEEVRQQYRKLAKQYHPDAGGNQEQFIKVNKAYTCVIEWIEEHAQ